MPIPGKRVTLQADDFTVPAIFWRASEDSTPRPAIIIGTGFDGTKEECYYITGITALERGCHVIAHEGPGQPSVLREQNLGFIHDWEKVIAPIADYLEIRPEVDSKPIGQIGISLGGYFCVRAAAFEHRLAATMAIDGVFDAFEPLSRFIPAFETAARFRGQNCF